MRALMGNTDAVCKSVVLCYDTLCELCAWLELHSQCHSMAKQQPGGCEHTCPTTCYVVHHVLHKLKLFMESYVGQ